MSFFISTATPKDQCYWCNGSFSRREQVQTREYEDDDGFIQFSTFHLECADALERHHDPVLGELEFDEYEMDRGLAPGEVAEDDRL